MAENTLVMKFGGTSVGTPEAMVQVAGIVRQARQEWSRVVIVTSALAGVWVSAAAPALFLRLNLAEKAGESGS